MQKGYLSPGRWTWFKSDNSDFMAYSERMRHLRIITNKAGFNDEYSFCNKEDIQASFTFTKNITIVTAIIIENPQNICTKFQATFEPNLEISATTLDIICPTAFWS
jgi:hypothetical protein